MSNVLSSPGAPVRRSPFLLEGRGQWQRWLVALAGTAAAIAHLPVIAPHLTEAPYMGVLFVLLTVGCLAISVTVLARDTAAVYVLAVTTCGLAVIGYAATRLVPFPMLADDVGNWLEPLGVVSVISETAAVVGAAWALFPMDRRSRRAASVPAGPRPPRPVIGTVTSGARRAHPHG